MRVKAWETAVWVAINSVKMLKAMVAELTAGW